MPTTKTSIVNMALIGTGEKALTDVDTDDTATSRKILTLYDQTLDEALTAGPEKGWKFTRRRYHGIDDDSVTVTAFTLASATTTTVTATHALVAGDMVEIEGTTSYDGTYDVVSVSTTVSFVITKTFVADDATGTARWTSEEYEYRYAVPTALRVDSASVGGIELTDWIQEGQYILTNMESEEIDVEFIQQVTTVTLFPPHFIKVFYTMLKVTLIFNFTQDSAHAERIQVELKELVMPKAIASDEQRKYVKESSESWVEVGNTMEVE